MIEPMHLVHDSPIEYHNFFQNRAGAMHNLLQFRIETVIHGVGGQIVFNNEMVRSVDDVCIAVYRLCHSHFTMWAAKIYEIGYSFFSVLFSYTQDTSYFRPLYRFDLPFPQKGDNLRRCDGNRS